MPTCCAVISFGLWGSLALRYWHLASHLRALAQLAGAACYMLPWLWCSMLGTESYIKHRLWIISGELFTRLLCQTWLRGMYRVH